jgi:CRP-like cAMP-binding protein
VYKVAIIARVDILLFFLILKSDCGFVRSVKIIETRFMSSDNNIVNLVRKAPWFQDIPQESLGPLIESGRVREYSANEYFYYFGDVTKHVYCILSGRVQVGIRSSIGQEFTITELKPGEWFGEASLAGDLGRILDARAKGKTTVVVFPRAPMLALGQQYPILYRNLFLDEINKARGAYTLLGGMLFYPLRMRLAGRLLEFIANHGEEADGGIYLNVKLSQNDFATLCMGSRQRVNKIFREWQEAGIVDMREGRYFVQNIEALKVLLADVEDDDPSE